MAMPNLTVVIPARNESENVGPLTAEIKSALDGVTDYEIIYVDDGSSDDTALQIAALRSRLDLGPRLRLLRHAHSCGQSTAVLSGVRAAHAEIIATLDSDGQNDPADLPRLLAAFTAPGRDPALQMVMGQRQKRRDTWLKRLSSRVANAVRGRLLRDQTPDTGCGIKLFSRAAFLQLPYFDHMHRFLPALVQRQGGKVISVGVNHRPRQHGSSNYGMWDRLWVGIVDMAGVAWLQRREKRPPAVTEEPA